MRATFQILAIPYKITDGYPLYCILHRRDFGQWQFIAGGGGDEARTALYELNCRLNAKICLKTSFVLKCFVMKSIIDFYKRNQKQLLPFFFALVLIGLTVIIALLTGHRAIDLESHKYTSLPMVIFSFLFIVAYCVLCGFLRIRKKSALLKGLLIYQFIGLISFIFHLILLMAEEESGLYFFFTYIFYWWSLPYHQGALFAIELFHFPVRYILMLILAMLTYITAKCLNGIRTDIAFEHKIQEKHDTEAQAEREKMQHRIQTAKEVEERNRKL